MPTQSQHGDARKRSGARAPASCDEGRIAPQNALVDRSRHDRGDEQSHLELERRILQRPRRLADDHDSTRQQQDDKRPPDEREEARQNVLQRLVSSIKAKEAKVNHQRGGRDRRDCQDVNGLNCGDDPIVDLDDPAHLGLLEPG